MIQFFVDHEGAHGIRSYLIHRGAAIAGSIRPVEYELLPSMAAIPASIGMSSIVPEARVAQCSCATILPSMQTQKSHWPELTQPATASAQENSRTTLWSAAADNRSKSTGRSRRRWTASAAACPLLSVCVTSA